MSEKIHAHKFVDWEIEEKEDFSNPKKFLEERYSSKFSFGLDNLKSRGVYLLLGWSYDFKPYLKKYLVKQYGSWSEYFAPNKSLLRKSLFGRVAKIQEVF